MNWLMNFIAAFRQAPQHSHIDAMTFVLPETTLLTDFHRLHLPLQLLYAFWATIALLFMVVGISIVSRMEAAAELSHFFVPTILILVGAGLLYECAIGIRLDAGQ